LNRNDTLTTLHTGSCTDVLTESTSHPLRDTVCTSTGGLLVFSKHVVREGVNSESVALCTGLITNRGVGNDTGGLESRVANLNIVIGTKFDDHLELTGFSSTTVSDVELHDTIVGYTTDVLSAGIGWAFQSAVHHSGFTCHRSASKHACDRCSLYDISAHDANRQRVAIFSPKEQSLHGANATASGMAGGWRRLLEEESEHQWLTLSLFALFVLFGAFAIDATEHFVGDRITNVTAQHQGGLVLDIEYHETNGSYTSLVFAPGAGYHLFTEHVDDGTASVVYSPETSDLADEVNFLKTMPDGEILFSVEPNQLIGLQGNTMVTYDYGLEGQTFTALDVAEFENEESTHRLMLTQEGSTNSFRGVVGMSPTAPMSTSSGVQWHHVEAHSEGLWVGLGTHISASGADGSSPATPEPRPVLGWISWDGGDATPVLRNVEIFSSGIFHSFATSGTNLIVGGTVESLIIGLDEQVQTLSAPSSLVVDDLEGTVWFIGALGSTTISTYSDGMFEVHQLSRSVPVDASDAGAQQEFIHVHGTDADGQPIQWSIDITADGSIESGRGFLNLLFLIGGGVMLAMMAMYAIEQLRSTT
jgi:hypothetical protein